MSVEIHELGLFFLPFANYEPLSFILNEEHAYPFTILRIDQYACFPLCPLKISSGSEASWSH
jgi:hypothetical protein